MTSTCSKGNGAPVIPLSQGDEYVRIYFIPPGRVIKGLAVKTGAHGTSFFLSEGGVLMKHGRGCGHELHERKNIAVYLSSNDLESLRKLGVFTRTELIGLKREAKRRIAEERRQRAVHEIRRLAAQLSLPRSRVNALIDKAGK